MSLFEGWRPWIMCSEKRYSLRPSLCFLPLYGHGSGWPCGAVASVPPPAPTPGRQNPLDKLAAVGCFHFPRLPYQRRQGSRDPFSARSASEQPEPLATISGSLIYFHDSCMALLSYTCEIYFSLRRSDPTGPSNIEKETTCKYTM